MPHPNSNMAATSRDLLHHSSNTINRYVLASSRHGGWHDESNKYLSSSSSSLLHSNTADMVALRKIEPNMAGQV